MIYLFGRKFAMTAFSLTIIGLAIAAAVLLALRVVPTLTLQNQIATLIAADTTTLAAATAMKVHLAIAPFTPSNTLTVASFTEATFTGYAALLAATGTQLTYTDPITGQITIEIKPPAAGWNFKATAGTGLPQTIYGAYLTDNGSATLYGSFLLPTPITLTAANQGFDIPVPRFQFLAGSPA